VGIFGVNSILTEGSIYISLLWYLGVTSLIIIGGSPLSRHEWCLRIFIYTTGYSPCLFPMKSETLHVNLNRRPFFSQLYLHTCTTIHCSPCRSSAHGAYERAEITSHVCFSSNGCTQTLNLTYHTYGKGICPHPVLCLHDHQLVQSRKRTRIKT
jgi:hypothetical protein